MKLLKAIASIPSGFCLYFFTIDEKATFTVKSFHSKALTVYQGFSDIKNLTFIGKKKQKIVEIYINSMV